VIAARLLVLFSCCSLAGACATAGSYERWERLRAQPAHAAWVACIDEQIRLRLTSVMDVGPPSAEAVEAEGKTDGEVFVMILNACRAHMGGFGDSILEDRRNKRMLMDAYGRYRSEINSMRAAEEAAII
jgi:hypothetical protein